MKPLRNLLLIKLDPKEEATKSGIIVKWSWERPQNIATVEEVGPEVKEFKKGDRVVINPYALLDITKDLKAIKESDILCRTE